MNSSATSRHSATPRRRITVGVWAGRARELDSPSLRWRFDDDDRLYCRRQKGSGAVDVSARKLAAGLWQSHLTEDWKYRSCNRMGCTLESSLPHPKSTMEGVTKLDFRSPRTCNEVYRVYSNRENQQVPSGRAVSSLHLELAKAKKRIHQLEVKCQSSEKTVRHLLRKLGEERASWKTKVLIDDLKKELDRERKNSQKMEILHSKLVNELAYVKVSAKKFLQHYEEEKRARRLMEEVFNEIAKEIQKDKVKIEALKKESMEVREEVEEERDMLQLAEVWREERVQMKLVDAKLALEDKYIQMNKLLSDLETFMGLRSATLDAEDLKKAELIHQAVKSVDIQDVKEFSYTSPESYDIFSIFKELQQDEANEEIEQCISCSPISLASGIPNVIPDPKGIIEETSGQQTFNNAKYPGSSYSLEDIDLSVNQDCRYRTLSTSGREWDVNAGQAQSETSEGSLVSAKQSKQEYTVSELLKLCQSNGEIYEIVSAESNRRLGSGEVLKHRDKTGKWSSRNMGNPHVAQGMKGYIQWPRSIHKNSFNGQTFGRRD